MQPFFFPPTALIQLSVLILSSSVGSIEDDCDPPPQDATFDLASEYFFSKSSCYSKI